MIPFVNRLAGLFRKRGSLNSSVVIIRPGLWLCIVSALVLGGCATATRLEPTVKGGRMELCIGDVIDTTTGDVITQDKLIEKISASSVVYVGETHTSVEDHKVQLAILKALQTKSPCVIMGMEMFPRSAQPILDRYMNGEIDEKKFLAETKWNDSWGFPYKLYRGLIDFAREKHIPVIGLNAPSDVVKEIARGGLASLSADHRAKVARDFHLDDPKNRARIMEDFEVHGKNNIKNFETFFAAQLAWEETMAETIVQHLKESDGKCKILVIVGKGHLTDGLGIPYLANMRVPHQYSTVAPMPINYPESTCDPEIAQYVLLTDKFDMTIMHPPRPRLGVKIQPSTSGNGVEVIEVTPESPAAKAGIRKSDIIAEVDDAPVTNVGEVLEAVANGGSNIKIMIERQKKKLKINVPVGTPSSTTSE